MKEKKKNQYWTDQHESLVIAYINSTNQQERNKIYNKLRPAVVKMIHGIFSKYAHSLYESVNENDLKIEVETHLVEKVIPNFKPDKGFKAFSYLGNSIKNYFYDVTKDIKKESRFEPLYQYWSENNEEGEIKISVDLIDDSIPLYQQNENYQELVNKVKRYIKKALNNISWNERLVLNTVLELLDQSNYDKYYAAYFIMSKSKLDIEYVYNIMLKFKLSAIISSQYDLPDYKNFIEENKKTGAFNVKDILNSIQHKLIQRPDEKRFKITDKQKSLKQRKATKDKLKNEKVHSTAG